MFSIIFYFNVCRTSVQVRFAPCLSYILSIVYKLCKRLAINLQFDFIVSFIYSPTCKNLSICLCVHVCVYYNFVPLWMFINFVFIWEQITFEVQVPLNLPPPNTHTYTCTKQYTLWITFNCRSTEVVAADNSVQILAETQTSLRGCLGFTQSIYKNAMIS
jgi:hypothetical protein